MPTDAGECDVLSLKFQKPQATEEFPVRGLAVRAGREALGLDFDEVSFSVVHRIDTGWMNVRGVGRVLARKGRRQ